MVRARPNFEWQVEAMNRIDRIMKTVTSALDEAGIPYAVIGGNAIATWVGTRDVGAIRATKDVDLLMRRADIDLAAKALAPLGFTQEEVRGIPVFIEASDPRPSQGVHIVLANEKVREHSGHASPDVTESVRAADGFSVLDLGPLLVMKLEANRRHDQVHIEDMLRVGLIDAPLAAALPHDLLDRLRHVRDTMEWFTDPPRF